MTSPITNMNDEAPPYQAPDILCVHGGYNTDTAKPYKGWAITHPVLGAEMFNKEEDADARILEIANSEVKYPNSTSKFAAWIHTQSNRQYWTPR